MFTPTRIATIDHYHFNGVFLEQRHSWTKWLLLIMFVLTILLVKQCGGRDDGEFAYKEVVALTPKPVKVIALKRMPDPDIRIAHYARWIKTKNVRISNHDAIKLSMAILDHSNKYKLDPNLVMAVAQKESNYNPKAEHEGAAGAMQVMLRVHYKLVKKFGITNPFDINANVLLGAHVLNSYVRAASNTEEALTHYNGQLASTSRYSRSVISIRNQIQHYVTRQEA